jgi:hypothetical protein
VSGLEGLDRVGIARSIDWQPTIGPDQQLGAVIVDQVLRLADIELRGEGGERSGVHGDTEGRGLTTSGVPEPNGKPGSAATPSSRSQARCPAHGSPGCRQCSRTLPGGLDEDGSCRGCATYTIDGVHWDTCPHRDVSPLSSDAPARPNPVLFPQDRIPRERWQAATSAVSTALNGDGDVAPRRSSEFYRYLIDEVLDALGIPALLDELSRLSDLDVAQPRDLMRQALRECGQENRRLRARLSGARAAAFGGEDG